MSVSIQACCSCSCMCSGHGTFALGDREVQVGAVIVLIGAVCTCCQQLRALGSNPKL